MVRNAEVIAIITGGGMGQRLPGKIKKQYLEFNGVPLIAHTIRLIHAFKAVDRIIVTVPSEDIPYVTDLCNQVCQKGTDSIKVITGGHTRQESVYNALKICPAETGYVMIHDAVRPFVLTSVMHKLLQAVKNYQAVIPATEVFYTIKEVEKTTVVKTLDRSRLVQANTPQVFDYQLIKSAYDRAFAEGLAFTDDASVLENFGYPVHTVSDSEFNIKLTTETDLAIMQTIYNFFTIEEKKRIEGTRNDYDKEH